MPVIFDTGSPADPYPSSPGTFKGTLTLSGSGYVKITGVRTRPCPGTGGHVESFDISAAKNNEVERGRNYPIEIKLGSYPQCFHNTDRVKTAGGVIEFSSFVDANGNAQNWIPVLIVEGESLPELTCDGKTPSYSSGCELLLSYDADNDGKIGTDDLYGAISDWRNERITIREIMFVMDAWAKDSINAKCPECYVTMANITFKTTPPSGVLVFVDGEKKGTT